MITATGKTHCVTCGEENVAYKCEQCSKNVCLNHLNDHHQLLIQQLDGVDSKRNIFRQILTEQTTNPQKHVLIQQINQWENDSINKIKQTADAGRQLILQHIGKHINRIEIRLTKLTEELKQIREEDHFSEAHLNELKQKLKQLEEQLNNPSNISIEQENSSSFINKISVLISSAQLDIPNNAKWIQNGITVAGGNGKDNESNQLVGAWSVYIDDDQTVYVADTPNNRIMEWKNGATSGQVVAGGNGQENRNYQFSSATNVIVDQENDSLIISDYNNHRVVLWPRGNGKSGEPIISKVGCWGLAIDNDGYLYVSDIDHQEVRRWKIGETNGTLVAGGNGSDSRMNGTLVAGGNGGGSRLDQLNGPYFIFVDEDHSVYVSDANNHRVMKWMKDAREGIVVAGGQGEGNSLKQLSNPSGIIVDQLGTLYVTDRGNHRVMRWLRGATEGSVVIGGNGRGAEPNRLSFPMSLSFDRQNNLYIADRSNHRVQKFSINPI